VIYYILITLYIVACFVLILFVLLQPSKSDASTVFGGGAGSAAFGPRGTQTVLAKITIGAAIAFFLIAFLFSIPGLFDKKSIGEGVGGQEAPPVQSLPAQTPDQAPPGTPPAVTPPATNGAQPAVTPTPAPATGQGAKQDAAKKPEAAKPADAAKKPDAKPNTNAPK
jgi:preprotein translocase subunit SecG